MEEGKGRRLVWRPSRGRMGRAVNRIGERYGQDGTYGLVLRSSCRLRCRCDSSQLAAAPNKANPACGCKALRPGWAVIFRG